jgi:hypothetical protein
LILATGDEAQEGELGYNIDVYAHMLGYDACEAHLNKMVPRIEEGRKMTAYNDRGCWYFVQPFQASKHSEPYLP